MNSNTGRDREQERERGIEIEKEEQWKKVQSETRFLNTQHDKCTQMERGRQARIHSLKK